MMRRIKSAGVYPWRVCAAVLALSLLSACAATVELAAPAADQAAKTFAPTAGMANIYVIREDRFTGSAVLFQLIVDQSVIGGLAPGTYHLMLVAPGPHTVSVTTSENQSMQQIDAVAGQSYFFEVKPRMGLVAARVEVTAMTAADGRAAVAANFLAQGIAGTN